MLPVPQREVSLVSISTLPVCLREAVLHLLVLGNQMHSSPHVLRWQDLALVAEPPRNKEPSGPLGWALVTQLPSCAWQRVSLGLGAKCWLGHEPYEFLLPAVLHRR